MEYSTIKWICKILFEYCKIKWFCKILLEYVTIKLYGTIKWMCTIKEICIIATTMVSIMFMWMCTVKYVWCDGKCKFASSQFCLFSA